jgi:hypothetical protein
MIARARAPRLVTVAELWEVGPIVWFCGYPIQLNYSYSDWV